MNIGKHMVATASTTGWYIRTKRGDLLGIVEWHARWRQWQFVPAVGTAFTFDCLAALGAWLLARNGERMVADAKRRAAGGAS